MDNTPYIKEFSYGKTEIINIIIPIITLCIGLPLTILGFFADVLNICISIFSRSVIEMKLLVELVVILLALGVLLTLPLTIINQYNTLQTFKTGLRVRVFIFGYKWKEIPWEDVVDLELSNQVDKYFQPIWLIMVKRLTYWHKQLGAGNGIGYRPCIVLTSELDNRSELLDIVRAYLKEHNKAWNNQLPT